MRYLRWARAHAVQIHDFIQLGAGTLACIAMLIFMAVSGRDADDPVMRTMATVGAVLAQSEMAWTGIDCVQCAETSAQPMPEARSDTR